MTCEIWKSFNKVEGQTVCGGGEWNILGYSTDDKKF